jgi:hypothetical protein
MRPIPLPRAGRSRGFAEKAAQNPRQRVRDIANLHVVVGTVQVLGASLVTRPAVVGGNEHDPDVPEALVALHELADLEPVHLG